MSTGFWMAALLVPVFIAGLGLGWYLRGRRRRPVA